MIVTLKRMIQLSLAVWIAVGVGLALRPTEQCSPSALDAVLDGGELILPADCVIMLDAPRLITGTVSVEGGMLHSGGVHRILEVAATGRLTLKNVRLLSGAADGGDGIGGGILNYGAVVLSRVRISANSAHQGGGIYNAAGATLRLEFSSIERNTAKESGGGIFNLGDATLIASYINGNRANYGAGIENKGSLTLYRANVINNRAVLAGAYGGYGGGISNKGTADIRDSRIRDNTAQVAGAGVDTNGRLRIHNSIIADNTCEGGCPGASLSVYAGSADVRRNYWGRATGPTAAEIHNVAPAALRPWLQRMPDWARQADSDG